MNRVGRKTPAELLVRGRDKRLCGLIFHFGSTWNKTINVLKASRIFLVYKVRMVRRHDETQANRRIREREGDESESPCPGRAAMIIVPQSPCNMMSLTIATRFMGACQLLTPCSKQYTNMFGEIMRQGFLGSHHSSAPVVDLISNRECNKISRIGNVQYFRGNKEALRVVKEVCQNRNSV